MIQNVLKQSARISPALLFTLYLFLPAGVVHADTRYVKPSSEIAVRTGQGTEYKIIAVVKDGTSVELLEEDESYAKVRLVDGKEGWIIKRFLSEEAPLQDLVASLQEENDLLKRSEIDTIQQLEDLSSKLEQTESELRRMLAEKDRISADYTKLQQETSDIVQLQKDSQQIMQVNKSLQGRLAAVNADYERLKKENAINWFLAGGGVLLVGILFGRISAASRKRKPSLL